MSPFVIFVKNHRIAPSKWMMYTILLLIAQLMTINLSTVYGENVAAVHDNVSSRSSLCPKKCTCFGDYLDCIKLNLKIAPPVPDWIRSLELSQNKFGNDINGYLRNLTKLNDLKLSKNRLDEFPIFVGLNALVTLQLSHNKIEIIPPEALLALPELTNLDLSKNAIQNIHPNTFPQKNHLAALNLNNNNIRVLRAHVLDNLKKLIDLKCNHNQLANLPNGLFRNVKHLKRLELSGNLFTEIPTQAFENLEHLRNLKLRNNKFSSLTAGAFNGLNNLTILELDNNYITSIGRGCFFNLSNLNSITLSNNSIIKIDPFAWEFTPRLANIDLSINNLTIVDGHTFACLKMLKELNLNNNQISVITDGAFDCTQNLEYFDLSENRIFWTIKDNQSLFHRLLKLDRFLLSGNLITSISDAVFMGLLSLTHLDLSNNNIRKIQHGVFGKIPLLQDLLLNTTDLFCDCNLQWFHRYIYSKQFHQLNVICKDPRNLRGKEFQYLREEDLICNESPKPRFIAEPQPQLAIKGKNISFTCSTTSSSSSLMQIKWKRDNVELKSSSIEINNQILSNAIITTSQLSIYDIKHEHAGKYQCISSNIFGTTYSQKFKVSVASIPIFRKVPSNLTINSTNTARLDCAAIGVPHPQIAWQKDGGDDFPAARERRMHVMPTDDVFFIINAKMSDQGVYTCIAENIAGAIKVNSTLTVFEAPTFVKPMENKEVRSGKSSVLECMASGSPKPKLDWLKDGLPIKVTERHFFAAEDQLLIIVDTVISDAGVYKCEMENILGQQSGVMKLKVIPATDSDIVYGIEIIGIVILTVVCCAVLTSIIWVVIIYESRKRNGSRAAEESKADVGFSIDANNKEDLPICVDGGNELLILHTTKNQGLLSNGCQIQILPIIATDNFVLLCDVDQDSGNGDSGNGSVHGIGKTMVVSSDSSGITTPNENNDDDAKLPHQSKNIPSDSHANDGKLHLTPPSDVPYNCNHEVSLMSSHYSNNASDNNALEFKIIYNKLNDLLKSMQYSDDNIVAQNLSNDLETINCNGTNNIDRNHPIATINTGLPKNISSNTGQEQSDEIKINIHSVPK